MSLVAELSPLVRRIVAPNPGPMTGDGTNTYLIGRRSVAILDPGPAIDSHIDAILAAVGERASHIVCTHTHPDHSPGAAVLAEKLKVPMFGATIADDGHQDLTFQPTEHVSDGDRFRGPDWTLTAIHTPGHVGNHFCFLLEEEGMVFAGDHIMNGSTVVIIPPSGDMSAYIASLKKLLDHSVECIAPGHGDVIPDCRGEVEKLVRHRMMREAKVVSGLEKTGVTDLDRLVAVVYDDVPTALHPWAKLSMEAHLIKLLDDQRVTRTETGLWQLS